MTKQEKISILEEIMDLEEGTLKITDRLDDYEEWDSIAALSLISIMDEKFHKTVTGKEIREFEKVEDVVLLME